MDCAPRATRQADIPLDGNDFRLRRNAGQVKLPGTGPLVHNAVARKFGIQRVIHNRFSYPRRHPHCRRHNLIVRDRAPVIRESNRASLAECFEVGNLMPSPALGDARSG